MVQVIGDRLLGYLHAVERSHRLQWISATGDTLLSQPEILAGLPQTAVQALGKLIPTVPVLARCRITRRLGDDLALYA